MFYLQVKIGKMTMYFLMENWGDIYKNQPSTFRNICLTCESKMARWQWLFSPRPIVRDSIVGKTMDSLTMVLGFLPPRPMSLEQMITCIYFTLRSIYVHPTYNLKFCVFLKDFPMHLHCGYWLFICSMFLTIDKTWKNENLLIVLFDYATTIKGIWMCCKNDNATMVVVNNIWP
jgi:hypothetical protein